MYMYCLMFLIIACCLHGNMTEGVMKGNESEIRGIWRHLNLNLSPQNL